MATRSQTNSREAIYCRESEVVHDPTQPVDPPAELAAATGAHRDCLGADLAGVLARTRHRRHVRGTRAARSSAAIARMGACLGASSVCARFRRRLAVGMARPGWVRPSTGQSGGAPPHRAVERTRAPAV